jgi:hypothetical protein
MLLLQRRSSGVAAYQQPFGIRMVSARPAANPAADWSGVDPASSRAARGSVKTIKPIACFLCAASERGVRCAPECERRHRVAPFHEIPDARCGVSGPPRRKRHSHDWPATHRTAARSQKLHKRVNNCDDLVANVHYRSGCQDTIIRTNATAPTVDFANSSKKAFNHH